MPISFHIGEVDNSSEAEEMLDARPQRVGHAVLLSDVLATRLRSSSIAVEVQSRLEDREYADLLTWFSVCGRLLFL